MSARGVDFEENRPLPGEDVDDYISQTEHIVNQRIRSRYEIPVTDETGVSLLRYIASRLTAATVWRVLQSSSMAGESEKAIEWERQAEKLLDRIMAGEIALGDAETTTETPFMDSGLDADHEDQRVWKSGQVQW
ncbi:MAG: hypothetical protein ACOC9Y_05020 [Chloroflexota bacterium]